MLSKELGLIKIEEFFQDHGQNVTESGIFEAMSALSNSSQYTQSQIFAFIISQGSSSPKLSLGKFIYSASLFKYSKKYLDARDQNALDIQIALEHLLSKKTTFHEMIQISLGGYNAHALDKYMECNPLLIDKLSHCSLYKNQTNFMHCTLFNETLSHYEVFLGVMKYCMKPATWEIQGTSYITDIIEAIAILPYEKGYSNILTQGQLPAIFKSSSYGNRFFGDDRAECHFANMYLKGGIVNTFNAPFLGTSTEKTIS